MRILIVDDEALARARLRALLEEIAADAALAEAANGQEALAQSGEFKPDVVLLDIRMPAMDGLETATHLAKLEPPPAIIFTTAYGDHALEAFKTHAVDYLLKPIRRPRLEQALRKARTLTRVQIACVAGAGAAGGRGHISVRLRSGIQLIPIEDVLCFRADQKYVTVVHRGGSALLDETLKSLEDEFGSRFLRIHRNALVARTHLKALEACSDGQRYVRLRSLDERLEVSRRHLPDVRKALKEKEEQSNDPVARTAAPRTG